MSPEESSSRARVVSFFSRDEDRSRGNSLRTRANFAATRTPRYLLAACFATSSGVKTRIGFSLCLWVPVQLLLHLHHEPADLRLQVAQPLVSNAFSVDDRRHAADRP